MAAHVIANGDVRAALDVLKEYDTSYFAPGIGRFRVNVYRQRGTLAVVMRFIPTDIPPLEALGLPMPVAQELAERPNGMVLVVGAAGTGKSTSISGRWSNSSTKTRASPCIIVTARGPEIEFLQPTGRGWSMGEPAPRWASTPRAVAASGMRGSAELRRDLRRRDPRRGDDGDRPQAARRDRAPRDGDSCRRARTPSRTVSRMPRAHRGRPHRQSIPRSRAPCRDHRPAPAPPGRRQRRGARFGGRRIPQSGAQDPPARVEQPAAQVAHGERAPRSTAVAHLPDVGSPRFSSRGSSTRSPTTEAATAWSRSAGPVPAASLRLSA